MSETSVISSNNYIKIDPRTELNRHTWYGRMWNIASVAVLVSYVALAVIAMIATGFLAPIYLPITMVAAILLADCAYNYFYEPLSKNGSRNTALAKKAQGIVDQLGKLEGEKKSNYLKARYKYYKAYTEKSKKKIAFYKNAAKEETKDNRIALVKMGNWLDKYLKNKSTAAYCKALKKDKEIEAPVIVGKEFSWRSLEKEFLKKSNFLELSGGTTLSAKEVKKLPINKLAAKILKDHKD